MGLDAVELVMAVEEEFGIAIDDRDAQQIVTVGQLWDHICRSVTFAPTSNCATSASFYRLRRAFIAKAVATRSNFRPGVPLDTVLPIRDRRAAWKQLEESAGLTLPALEIPAVLEHVQMWLIVGLPMSAAVVLAMNDHVLAAVVALFGGILLAAKLFEVLARPWQNGLNPAWATAGGLAQAVVGLNPDAWSSTTSKSREIAWQRLRALIAEDLGVSLEMVQPEASFVNDLGMS